jgi:small redox-active disulfide protein 2
VKEIVVLGPGCPRCERLAATTREVADRLGLDYELTKITDITRFAEFGVMMTPGLVVDGELKVQGKVPTTAELETMLR